MLSNKKLTETCDIYRLSTTPDEYGEVGATKTLIYSNIKIRIVNSKNFNTETPYETGSVTKGTNLIFMNLVDDSGVDITLHVGDIIEVDGVSYTIDYLENAPGGKLNHHRQIYVSKMVTV